MKRVVVKYDLEKLLNFGFEVYSDGLFQANNLGLLSIYNRDLLSSNKNLYNKVILVYKDRNIVKFKINFYIKDIDCNVYDKDLLPFINVDNGLLTKVNSNIFDYDYIMYKLHEADLLEIIEEGMYV